MLVKRRVGGPSLNQYWFNLFCLMGLHIVTLQHGENSSCNINLDKQMVLGGIGPDAIK